MVEGCSIEWGNVFATALVISVAGLAFSHRWFWTLAVKAKLVADVGGNLLVTIKAKAPLTGFREWFMATFAGLFQFGM